MPGEFHQWRHQWSVASGPRRFSRNQYRWTIRPALPAYFLYRALLEVGYPESSPVFLLQYHHIFKTRFPVDLRPNSLTPEPLASVLVAVPPLSLAAERIYLQHLMESILLRRYEINTIADCNYEGDQRCSLSY